MGGPVIARGAAIVGWWGIADFQGMGTGVGEQGTSGGWPGFLRSRVGMGERGTEGEVE